MNTRIGSLIVLGMIACNAQPTPTRTDTTGTDSRAAPAPVTEMRSADAPAETQRASVAVVSDRSQVCMINDQFMGSAQIPVTVGEKTYYGCCAMCKERLERDPSTRLAKDPVTGSAVDKATALIGRAASGKVFYFESDDTLRRFQL